MSQLSVLVTDYTWETTAREAAVLNEIGAELVVAQTGEESELVELVAGVDAILTCFATVGPAVVQAGRRLQVIGRYGIGVDNIAVDEATRLGIPVTNVPAYCLDEVAEHVLAVLFTMVRGVHLYDRAVRRGDWSLAVGQPVRRIAGRTLGIVGFGKIGHTVARRAGALGLRVIAYDSHASEEAIRAGGAEPVDLLELASRADFISLHIPLTSDTEALIDADFIDAMKPDAYLINTARGAVLDQEALTRALGAGTIGGAALDVFVPERLADGHPLLASERLVATPHVAFYSEESVAALATLAARNVAAVLVGRRAFDTVNPSVYELPRWSHLTPQAST